MLQLRRVLARWARYEVIGIDEVGYVPMADVGGLFQVLARFAYRHPGAVKLCSMRQPTCRPS
jgi:hypothetical protein